MARAEVRFGLGLRTTVRSIAGAKGLWPKRERGLRLGVKPGRGGGSNYGAGRGLWRGMGERGGADCGLGLGLLGRELR